METLLLRATHPCCGGAVRLQALPSVPRERYERPCRRCGWAWAVTRTTLTERDGVRLDQLDWDQAPVPGGGFRFIRADGSEAVGR